MPAFNRLYLLAAVLALASSLDGLAADGPTPAAPPASVAAKPAAKQDSSEAIDSMCKMIPEGRRNLKVHYPGFDNGRPSSLVTAGAMTRVNPQEMFAEKLRIDLYGKEQKDNMRVDLKTGTYHMDSKLLTSNERSHVTRSDFKIDGDGMEFDMTSSQGKMIGNVRMVIYDTSSFIKKDESSAESKAPTSKDSSTTATAKEPTPPGK